MSLAAMLDTLDADFARVCVRPVVAEHAPRLAYAAMLARSQGSAPEEIERRIEAELSRMRGNFTSLFGATVADAMIEELRCQYRDSAAELAARTAGQGTA